MYAEMMMSGSGGGSDTKLIAWAKGGVYTWSTYDADADYVTVSTDRKTLTFKKACKGFFGATTETITVSGTCSFNAIANAEGTYTDKLYSFEANAGDTLVFTLSGRSGYEVIGS